MPDKEKDKRQLAAMSTQLNHYVAGELPLQGLIGDLDFLLSHVEDAPDDWKEAIHSHVTDLEEVYAVSLDMKEMREADKKLIDESVRRLLDLVRTRQQALEEPDDTGR